MPKINSDMVDPYSICVDDSTQRLTYSSRIQMSTLDAFFKLMSQEPSWWSSLRSENNVGSFDAKVRRFEEHGSGLLKSDGPIVKSCFCNFLYNTHLTSIHSTRGGLILTTEPESHVVGRILQNVPLELTVLVTHQKTKNPTVQYLQDNLKKYDIHDYKVNSQQMFNLNQRSLLVTSFCQLSKLERELQYDFQNLPKNISVGTNNRITLLDLNMHRVIVSDASSLNFQQQSIQILTEFVAPRSSS